MAACIFCDDVLTHVWVLVMLRIDAVVLANNVVDLRGKRECYNAADDTTRSGESCLGACAFV